MSPAFLFNDVEGYVDDPENNRRSPASLLLRSRARQGELATRGTLLLLATKLHGVERCLTDEI